MVVQLTQAGVRRQFLADTRASQLRGNAGMTTEGCILLVKYLAVPDTNIWIVSSELTKVKITVVINLKWPNIACPSCCPVGRPHLTCPVTTKSNIPWVELVLPSTRIGRLYLLTYLLMYLLTYLITYLLTYLFTYLFNYLRTYLLNYLPTHLRNYLFTCLITYLLTYSLHGAESFLRS